MKLEYPVRLGGLAALAVGVLLLVSQLVRGLPQNLPFQLSFVRQTHTKAREASY